MSPKETLTAQAEKGANGELIKAQWFQALRHDETRRGPAVVGSYIAMFVVSCVLILSGAANNFWFIILNYGLWTALAYGYIAFGTALSHKMAAYGIGIGGVAMSLGGVWAGTQALRLNSLVGEIVSPALVWSLMITYIVLGVCYGWFGYQMHRIVTTPEPNLP